jgi:hypothetical protein
MRQNAIIVVHHESKHCRQAMAKPTKATLVPFHPNGIGYKNHPGM